MLLPKIIQLRVLVGLIQLLNVQVPKLHLFFEMTVLQVPVQLGGHCFCPPFARLDPQGLLLGLWFRVVPIDVPVKTGKEKSAVPTYPNNFMVEAAASVSTAVGPCAQERCANFFSWTSSSSSSADTSAAAKFPSQEYPADGDQTHLNFSPPPL